jgi:hypothetical protein
MDRKLAPSGVRDQCAEFVAPQEILCVRFVRLGKCLVFSVRKLQDAVVLQTRIACDLVALSRTSVWVVNTYGEAF